MNTPKDLFSFNKIMFFIFFMGLNSVSAYDAGDLARALAGDKNLQNADLRDAPLQGCDLSYANLESAQLQSANLRHANLVRANISHANLSSADLTHAVLLCVEARHTIFQHATICFSQMGGGNFSHADLSYADLSYADLSYADLSAPLVITRDDGSLIIISHDEAMQLMAMQLTGNVETNVDDQIENIEASNVEETSITFAIITEEENLLDDECLICFEENRCISLPCCRNKQIICENCFDTVGDSCPYCRAENYLHYLIQN